jgi:hypothetical protein
MEKRKSNEELFPECWAFFIEHARNLENEPDYTPDKKYSVPWPDMSGRFIYADDTPLLFRRLLAEFYKPSLNSPSVYGKIQYIVEHFNH